MIKVKFRVYETKICRECGERHPQPTHRYIYHQGDGSVDEVIQLGHTLASNLLERENEKGEEFDRRHWKKSPYSKTYQRHNLQRRPLYQYHFEVK